MNKVISMDEMGEIIKEQLQNGGKVRFTPKGVSMLPMLQNNKDTVLLEKPHGALKKYDLPLYQRDSKKYILHRVVKVCDDGTYVMCGDNQILYEYGITDAHIVGIVTEFDRKGKKYSVNDRAYRIYCHLWVALMPVRRIYRLVRKILGKIKRRIVFIVRLIITKE